MEKVVCDYKKASDILTDLAEYALAYWKVNPDKSVDFRVKGSEPAPFPIVDGNDTYIPDTLSVEYSTEQMKNVVYVIGSNYVANTTTDVIGFGNGEQTTFRLPYVYDKVPQVKVNGVVQNVGVAYLDKSGFDCYWDRNGKNLIFEIAPINGAKIEVTGDPLVPLIARLSKGGAHRYEAKIVDKTITSRAGVEARGNAELELYGEAITKATLKTYRKGFKTGQRVTLDSDLLDVHDEYIITSIRTQIEGNDEPKLVYELELANKAEYDLVDLFRYLIRVGEKSYGIFQDTETILLDYIGKVEKMLSVEKWELFAVDVDGKEIIKGTDNLIFNDIQPIYVWAPYPRQGANDPKVSPKLDAGVVWI